MRPTTVQDLIDRLMKIEDKTIEVCRTNSTGIDRYQLSPISVYEIEAIPGKRVLVIE
jgi:hypothetical protein